jgi:hypothetical protein
MYLLIRSTSSAATGLLAGVPNRISLPLNFFILEDQLINGVG